MRLRSGLRLSWEYLWGLLLGPFSVPLRRHIAINQANQSFAHIHQFIANCNESLAKYLPSALLESTGVSLTEWSREGDDIISNLTLKSLRKQETTIPVRVTVGTEQVRIGEELMLLSDSEKIPNSISRRVANFFGT